LADALLRMLASMSRSRGSLSRMMKPISRSPRVSQIGTAIAPAHQAAYKAWICAGDFGVMIPTRSPGWTPRAVRNAAHVRTPARNSA